MSPAVIHLIAAARPNFMKIAPLYHALRRERWAQPVLVHTGQHYDAGMCESFFQDLGLPSPDIALGIGSGSHAEQTGGVMIAYEQVLLEQRPDLCVVVGDVNSTIACTLAAAKLGIKTAHLEAGLRSFDRTMPEELNRILTDALADLLWTPSPDADANLEREGIPAERIVFVGNIMIDSLQAMLPRLDSAAARAELGLTGRNYCLATFHRPSNVDDPGKLRKLCSALAAAAKEIAIVLPLHPRTRKMLTAHGLLDPLASVPGLQLTDPLPYRTFMALLVTARIALTDSGGIQEETTYLGIPCLTVRDNTERPITVQQGTNRLIKIPQIPGSLSEVLHGSCGCHTIPELWDGKTAERVTRSIAKFLGRE